jgi:sugar O-acyltransferase (sialic acid O-acetyltransferase NeuD family)
MYLYGASGHAKVIIDILEGNKIVIDGLFDDNADIKQLMDYHVFSAKNNIEGPLIISIGNNEIRKQIAENLTVEFGRAVHCSAIVSDKASIGNGTVVMQNAVIQSSTSIGKHCIINTATVIEHDCLIDNFVHISPHATLCGNVQIGEGTCIGAGATVIQGIKIGKWAVIGAGAVVIEDVPDDAIMAGVPARILKYKQ